MFVCNDRHERVQLGCLRRVSAPLFLFILRLLLILQQWGAEDAEIKVPSDENTALKRSPFKAWSRSVYSHTCYAY